jgi:hypothetical protein
MGFLFDLLTDLLASLLNWKHILIILGLIIIGGAIYKFLLPLFGAS